MSSAKLRNINWIEHKNTEVATADALQHVESIGVWSHVNEQVLFGATAETARRSHYFRVESAFSCHQRKWNTKQRTGNRKSQETQRHVFQAFLEKKRKYKTMQHSAVGKATMLYAVQPRNFGQISSRDKICSSFRSALTPHTILLKQYWRIFPQD